MTATKKSSNSVTARPCRRCGATVTRYDYQSGDVLWAHDDTTGTVFCTEPLSAPIPDRKPE